MYWAATLLTGLTACRTRDVSLARRKSEKALVPGNCSMDSLNLAEPRCKSRPVGKPAMILDARRRVQTGDAAKAPPIDYILKLPTTWFSLVAVLVSSWSSWLQA